MIMQYPLTHSSDRAFSYSPADFPNLRNGVTELDHSGPEAEFVAEILKQNSYSPTLMLGTQASEESFKNLSGRNNEIIHIASHGFYWTENQADKAARYNKNFIFMSQRGDNAFRHAEDRALTRSGVLMAGANHAFNGETIPTGIDDGVLTAQEISRLDLRGADLVVLSACETGMGEISGDGVFGLQRGLKKAGVNSVLMSLWKVDDNASEILMKAFYRNLMSGLAKQQSLLNAQKELRDKGFDDPYFWGAFILLDALN